MLILLNKPYRVLCQFTDPNGRPTLSDFVEQADVYAAGRLDFDSEGLLALTDEGSLQARISQPKSKIEKRYWAQVEGIPSNEQLEALIEGVELKDGLATAVDARTIDPPSNLWDREPPIRYRQNVADSWLEITLSAGKNRQVRRMTAAVGLPTLRLIRSGIGPWSVQDLEPGKSREISTQQAWADLRGLI